jgi:hypothetical protein
VTDENQPPEVFLRLVTPLHASWHLGLASAGGLERYAT